MKTSEKIRALVTAYIELADRHGYSETATTAALLDVFYPEELEELGFGDRVMSFFREEIMDDVHRVMELRFPSCHDSFPDAFLEGVVQDVFETSAWRDSKEYSDDDISLAIQRETLKRVEGSN